MLLSQAQCTSTINGVAATDAARPASDATVTDAAPTDADLDSTPDAALPDHPLLDADDATVVVSVFSRRR